MVWIDLKINNNFNHKKEQKMKKKVKNMRKLHLI